MTPGEPMIPEPLRTWLAEQSALTFVVLILVVLWIIRLLWQWAAAALPVVERSVEFLRALGRLPEFMAKTEQRMDAQDQLIRDVKHEVLPNSGGSMRDEQTTIGLRLEKIEAKLAKDHERFSRLEAEIKYREEYGIGIPSPVSVQRGRASGLMVFPADDTETTPDKEVV